MDFAPYQSSPPEYTRVTSPTSPPPSQQQQQQPQQHSSQTTSPPSHTSSTAVASPRASLDAPHTAGHRSFSPHFPPPQGARPSPSPSPASRLQHPQPQRSWYPPPPNAGPFGDTIDTPFRDDDDDTDGPADGGESGLGRNLRRQERYSDDVDNHASHGGRFGPFSALHWPGAGSREGVSEFATSTGLRLDYEACLTYLAFPPIGAIILLIIERESDYVRFHAWQSSLVFTALFFLRLLLSFSSFLSSLAFLGHLGLIGLLTYRAYQDADTLDRYEVPFFGRVANKILDDE